MSIGIYDRLVDIEDALGELLADIPIENEHDVTHLQLAKWQIAYVLDDIDQRQESRGQ